MRVYLKQNVFDAALDRIRWLFDEFENVVINVSGGKDSTVVLNLALQVAEEKGRLPLPVLFVDQEAEWQTVIDYIRTIMNDPRVEPRWLQVPIKIFNATSPEDPWLYCWEAGKEDVWIRPQEPNAIKVNRYGTDRFKEFFGRYLATEYPDAPAINIAGVRCEESPNRLLGLTTYPTYKSVTWGQQRDRKRHHYDFYPIYDWSYTDVWKAIHDNGWPYCRIYDYMYQYGIPVHVMHVGNAHHETALDKLFYLQEIEADTWNRITRRIRGISTAGKLGFDDFYVGQDLPFMFADWREYRDYLLEHLITDPAMRKRYVRRFLAMDNMHSAGKYDLRNVDQMYRTQINTILANDFEFTKLRNFEVSVRNRVGR